jgi:Rod binding domain-containing protein
MNQLGILTREWSPAQARELRARAADVAGQFEQIFAQTMVSALRDETGFAGGEPMFGSGPGADTYSMWFDTLMAERVTQSNGIGLADALLRDWERLGQIPPATKESTDVRA